jgi:hypothetical protein
MSRALGWGLLAVTIWIARGGGDRLLLAQFQNPAGFQDPAGAGRAGTGNPPNTSIGPLGGSTLPPGAPAAPREIETNSALRQEVRRPFGGGGYAPSGRAAAGILDHDPAAAQRINLSERQNMAHVPLAPLKPGKATGALAADPNYRYFQERHWYWMPDKTWDVWTGTEWKPYQRGMFSRPIFGYGTQVRSYRPIPPGYRTGTYQPPLGPPQLNAEQQARTPADRKTDRTASTPTALAPAGDTARHATVMKTPVSAVDQGTMKHPVGEPARVESDEEVVTGPFSIDPAGEKPGNAKPAADAPTVLPP